MLIKLTAVPHPDINGGKSFPMYVDASRILNITRTMNQHVRMDRVALKREAYDELYHGIQRLNKQMQQKMPVTIETEGAERWAREIHAVSHEIEANYQSWRSAYRAEDFYDQFECTELQLACGTALEHGVMLARCWVTEQPDEVAEKMLAAQPYAAGMVRR